MPKVLRFERSAASTAPILFRSPSERIVWCKRSSDAAAGRKPPERQLEMVTPETGKTKILIIDDEVAVRASITAILRHENYLVAGARSLKEGREMIMGREGSAQFDLILIDVQ